MTSDRPRIRVRNIGTCAGSTSASPSRNPAPSSDDGPRQAPAHVMVTGDTGSRPHLSADLLRWRRPGVIGVVGIDSALYGPTSIRHGIERAARAAHLMVTVHNAPAHSAAAVATGIDALREQLAEGVIVIAPLHRPDMEPVPADFPVVDAGGGLGGQVPVTAIDQRRGAARATRHLLGLGHRTVWHIAGPSSWIDATERLAGWREALEDAGREVRPPLTGDWTARSGYRLGRYLARDHDVTAVFAANDSMAIGLLRALREAGRRVPEDVSVVGFDDLPESSYTWPPLTTVRQNFAEVGTQALRMLLRRIERPLTGRVRAHFRTSATVNPKMVFRASTGRPAR
ncbi:substrate-binding domain-containing protein [Streptosporangium longisporum]|uniref:substrate-binding domain-containing protein n=1 Tax=Streptosporangium longisporum TaxID=46187 RepID=UPI0031E5071B